MSVPAGFVDHLPIGLQIVANRGQDDLVLRVGRRLEQLAPWPLVASSAC
jgi:Asp-tRNA(Asn)/Glu-tRNA(Gln) amidotransferase A subunit family amidase